MQNAYLCFCTKLVTKATKVSNHSKPSVRTWEEVAKQLIPTYPLTRFFLSLCIFSSKVPALLSFDNNLYLIEDPVGSMLLAVLYLDWVESRIASHHVNNNHTVQ